VHVFGQCADVEALRQVLPSGAAIVEDAAEAHGAHRFLPGGARRAGALGDAGAFSFYFTKNLGGYGEGGFVTASTPEIAAHVALLRNHGQPERFQHTAWGFNSRLDELQAAVLDIKLARLEDDNRARIEVAGRYTEGLSGLVETPVVAEGGDHVFYAYVIQTEARDRLQQHLSDHGIGTATYWPIPIHLQPVARDLGYREGSLPCTEAVAHRVLALPMYPQLNRAQVDRIVGAVRSFFGAA
jgi:dTDP-4-amino-4,6-dideoxygalactose transaminase